MLNKQKPEPFAVTDGRELDVIDIFYTIQGEGPFTGWPAIFIRLAGCNLQCPGCDTIYTGPARRTRSLTSILRSVMHLAALHPGVRLVVITGGEPLRQAIEPLVWDLLSHAGTYVQIETNGVFPAPDGFANAIRSRMLALVVSPKTSRINDVTASMASCFKYVISHDDVDPVDGLPRKALGHKAKPHVARPPAGFTGLVYVNPCDDKDLERNRLNLLAARDSAMRYGYVLGVQLHKIIDVP